MIFVTVGAQMPFDRLVRAVDGWAAEAGVEVVAQVGDSAYRPRHLRATPWLGPDAFRAELGRAEAVIGHAGMGTILSALELGKPLLVMPRRAALGETRNDHQVATAKRFAERGWLRVAESEADLPAQADALLRQPESVRVPAVASDALLRRLRAFARGEDEPRPRP